MQIVTLLDLYKTGKINKLFSEFNSDESDKKTIDGLILSITRRLGNKADLDKFSELIEFFSQLKKYTELLEHPIRINQYKDKYENIYLQARTSLKDEKGRMKSINAYVGTLKDYPDGVDDKDAIIRGKKLLRNKIKKYFGLTII